MYIVRYQVHLPSVSLKDAMGRHVSNPALTKLPSPLFDDLSPGGSLCHILATAYRVKTEQSW